MMSALSQVEATAPDALEASKDHLVALVFAKTNSPYYQHAVGVASGAYRYWELGIEKSVIHSAVFSKDQDQAARAITLLRYISTWNTLQVFVNGRLYTDGAYSLTNVLECYQKAMHCRDRSAHCVSLLSNVFKPTRPADMSMSIRVVLDADQPPEHAAKILRFFIPCRLLPDRCFLDKDHPASWADQVQAYSVSVGVDWCPCFDMNNFRQLE